MSTSPDGRWHASEELKDQTARAVAEAVGGTVAELSQGERDNPPKYSGRTVSHADGWSLRLTWEEQYGSKPGRLVVRGQWASTQAGEVKIGTDYAAGVTREERRAAYTTEITLDPGKPADRIVADIRRRLLTGDRCYLTAFAYSKAAAEAADRYAQASRDAMHALLVAAGGGAHQSQNGGRDSCSIYFGSAFHCYSAQVSGESVRFEAFSVPLELATALVELLRKPQAEIETEEREELNP